MGHNNHNMGMHFVHHSKKISEKDALSYLDKKNILQKQATTKDKYNRLLENEKSCHFTQTKSTIPVHVNFYNENEPHNFSMYHYCIKNYKKKSNNFITLWVGYDIGGKNDLTGDIEPRGYYLYFKHRFANVSDRRKLLLFEVEKKSDLGLNYAYNIASHYAKDIVTNYYPSFDIDWNNPIIKKNGKNDWIYANVIRQFRTIKNCNLEIEFFNKC